MPASASTVIQTLTNYARGFAQDKASALAEFIAPTVPVGSASGRFKSFNDKNAFQILDTARALGGPAKRLEFDASDPTFNCTPQALEVVVDDHERELAGDGDQLGLEQAKVETLVTSATLSHEDKVFAAIKAAVSAVGGVGVWSSASNDPIAEIDAQIEAIALETGMMPNRIVFGLGAWRVFRNHAKVLARQPGASLIGVTAAQAAAVLLNPAMEVRVGVLSKDATKFGATKSASNIVGGEVFVFLGAQSPTLYDPSFAKTFRTRNGGVDAVRMYREDRNRGDVLAVDWSEDIQVVSTSAVRRITLS
jgi:hypothetical protein